jgi:hypothetical protein
MSAEELDRVTKLHMEIRKAAHSTDHDVETLWKFIEKLAQELMIVKAEVEARSRPYH